MSPNPMGGSWWRAALLLFLFLTFNAPLMGLAKTKGTRSGADYDINNIIRPEIVNPQTNPTLRFPVMSMPGSVFSITYGWLEINRSTIRYTVVQPLSKSDHSFEVSRFAIGDLRFNRTVLTFKSPDKRQIIVYLTQDRWGSVHSGPGMGQAANRGAMGTQSIYKTFMFYDAVLAMLQPPPPPPAPVVAQPLTPPPPPKPAPASPPAIVLSSPAGAGPNQTLEVEESTLVIRGVAMDSTGIPVVSINGSPANMRPQTTEAAQFWSDPLPLKPGNNRIQIVASNSAHSDAQLELTVHHTPKQAPANPRALGRQDIIGLLEGGVPPARVADLIKDRGIKFSPTADDQNTIRAAGATEELIAAIQQAAPRP